MTVAVTVGVTFPVMLNARHMESQPLPVAEPICLATPILVKAFVPSETAVTWSTVCSLKTAAISVLPLTVVAITAVGFAFWAFVLFPLAVWMSAIG